ncbi:Phospho-N-acetylmuramoyl-pentapeptide-transferase [bacterium HR40]|nr:Phospho-N-acetylmuramoyl-pentapeptide-transferase [bacterium HR40]
MLYHLLYPLADQIGAFNVFRYLTFRTGGAVMTALFLSFLLGPPLIRWLRATQNGMPHNRHPVSAASAVAVDDARTDPRVLLKQSTPTMGGLLILLTLTLSTLLWVDWRNPFVWTVLAVTLTYGAIGFADDWLKLRYRQADDYAYRYKGLPARVKFAAQTVVAVIAAWILGNLLPVPLGTSLAVPFFKDLLIPLGPFFPLMGAFVVVGSSNAVNLTDGLDGLAIGPVMIAASCFALIAYLAGNAIFANYLGIPYVPGTGELAVFCGAMVGASMGFLWFNAPPAMVFMGDTGSLSTGGALGAVAVAAKHELVLAIVGGLFVLEAVSVIVQVLSFKLTGRRVFRMAPLHHHFERKGWQEPTIVIRFWIVAAILALIGLSTLKLR